MLRFFVVTIFSMLLSHLISFAASADIITLTDGQTYEGEITAEEDERVQIKLDGSGARLWFPRDQISSIEATESEEEEWESEEEDALPSDDSSEEDDDTKRARQLLEEMRKQSKELSSDKKARKKPKADAPRKKPAVKKDIAEDDPEVIDRLINEMRNSPQPFKRVRACKKLGEVGGERAIPHLIHALDDKAPSIRKAAIGSLKKITGTDLNYNPTAPRAVRLDFIKEWEKWWEEKQDKEGMETLKSTLF